MKNLKFLLIFLISFITSSFLFSQIDTVKNQGFEVDGYFFFRPDLDFNHGNPDFYIGNKAFNFFLRSDLGFTYKLSKNVMVKTTLQSFGVYTLDEGPLDVQLKLYEAYAEMKNIGNSPLHLKFGRFSLGDYGSGMIIGDREWYNGRSFEAVKLTYQKNKLTSDLIWLQLYQLSNQLGGWNHPVLFLQHNNYKLAPGNQIDAYLYFLVDKHIDPYRAYTFMPGIRWENKSNKLQYHLEVNPQIGYLTPGIDNDSVGGGNIFAYGLEAGIAYVFNKTKQTMLKLEYYLASGDEDLTDNQLNTYNQFWQDEHQRFGHIDLFLGSNIQSILFGFSSKLSENLFAGINISSAQVQVVTDPAPGLIKSKLITELNEDSGAYLGTGSDIYCKYIYSEALNFRFNYSVFVPGNYITNNGGSSDLIMRFYTMCSIRF